MVSKNLRLHGALVKLQDACNQDLEVRSVLDQVHQQMSDKNYYGVSLAFDKLAQRLVELNE